MPRSLDHGGDLRVTCIGWMNVEILQDVRQRWSFTLENRIDIDDRCAGSSANAGDRIKTLIEDTVAEYIRHHPQRALTVNAVPLPSLDSSTTYIEQVVRNLIENADKYSPETEAIEVESQLKPDGVEVRVLDRVGIAPDELSLVFDSFFR